VHVVLDMLVISALVFLAIAAFTTVVGVYAELDQGLPQLMYWLSGLALVTGAGLLLAHLSLRLRS